MASRTLSRACALAGAALSFLRPRPRARPREPRAILVLHELLLGDTLMLAPLLAALRARYPAAALYVAARPETMPLFSGRPYGAQALAFSERDPRALQRLHPARGCDLAIIPGENRYAIAARALGARWIVALAQARPAWKNWFVDERVDFPERALGMADIFATLAGPSSGLRYRAGDWPAPDCAPYQAPAAPYAVLHIGASTPLKYWPAQRWQALAERLSARYQVVWSAGPRERGLIAEVDPAGRFPSYAGTLDLAQLWHLVAGASLLVALDTGVAHLAKLTGTPAVCLYGPGSPVLVGRGEFFKDAPFREVAALEFPCRDQRLLFKRQIPWVRRCGRTRAECPRPRCMEAIGLEEVVRSGAAVMRS